MSDEINKTECYEVSLNEIKEKLGNKVNKQQKDIILKKTFLNIGILAIMLLYCIVLVIGKKNISIINLFKGTKILTLFIVIIGILILEIGYKKEKKDIFLNAIEIILFGHCNICLIYVLSLYPNQFINIVAYFGSGIIVYYFIKIIILLIWNIKKYKKENNDIKEIIKNKF